MNVPPATIDGPAFSFTPYVEGRASALPAFPYVVGDLFTATGTQKIGRIADVALGSVLMSGGIGVVPAWQSSISLANGGVTVAGASGVTWGFTRCSIVSPNINIFDFRDTNSAIGFALDTGAADVMRVRKHSNSGQYASVDCLGLLASGVAGFNGTVTPVTTITVANGIVTNVA